MDDRKLDVLLEELSEIKIQPDRKLIYEARQKARDKAYIKEKKREWYPFIIIMILNVFLVVAEVFIMICLSGSLEQIVLIVGIGFFSMQMPIVAYLLGKIYYKEKEIERN